MSSYDADFEVTLDANLLAGADASAALRAVSWLPIEMRMAGMRVLMFLSAGLLTDSPEMAATTIGGMRRALTGYGAAASVISGRDGDGALHPEVATTLAAARADNPLAIAVTAEFHQRMQAICLRLEASEPVHGAEFDHVLRDVYDTYHPKLIKLGVLIGAIAAARRAEREAAARAALARAKGARVRIQSITRTVRLLSINAKVEAARAGEAGRSFGVIAREIESLSEQTAEVSAQMGESMEAIFEHGRMV